MSAIVPSKFMVDTTIHFTRAEMSLDEVHVMIVDSPVGNALNVTRTDLLAAISSELGVVIIDKADLPEARPNPRSTGVVGARGFDRALNADTDEIRADAYALLAIADYIEAGPPVDEAQVSALAEIVRAATDTPLGAYIGADLTSTELARRLIATGKVEVRS